MDYESVSEEMKAKIKACTSPEEMLALAQEEGYELSDEDLEGIAGGGWGSPCPHRCGDSRDDVVDSSVSEAYRTGALRGDGRSRKLSHLGLAPFSSAMASPVLDALTHFVLPPCCTQYNEAASCRDFETGTWYLFHPRACTPTVG